jgi:hypothetical protein
MRARLLNFTLAALRIGLVISHGRLGLRHRRNQVRCAGASNVLQLLAQFLSKLGGCQLRTLGSFEAELPTSHFVLGYRNQKRNRQYLACQPCMLGDALIDPILHKLLKFYELPIHLRRSRHDPPELLQMKISNVWTRSSSICRNRHLNLGLVRESQVDYAGEIYWRKPELKGKDKPKVQTVSV